jgi:hypothetical protein
VVAGAAVSAASVTTSINYQGRLTDSSGSPLSGTYTMTFGLYDVSTGGTALATDAHEVDVADGLFNTGTDFDQSYFDGRELWLGVTVGTDSEMTPRQELRPVPYALSLVPGANIIGSAPVAFHAESTHPSGKGIRGYATATSGANYGVYGASMSADGAGVYALGRDSGADLILGGNADTVIGDDGKIYSDPAYDSSDIYLITNDGLRIDLDNDGDGEDADFEIYDKDDNLIFNVDESGDVTYGGSNIAAFPRPAYDRGWVSISKGTTKTLTHDLGGNPDNYVFDLQFYDSSLGRHKQGYGGNHASITVAWGAYWKGLDDTRIAVYRYGDDSHAEKIRVRIWVYK